MRNTVGYFRTGGKDPILLANSKSLSFSTLIFGKAQERLDLKAQMQSVGAPAMRFMTRFFN